MMSVDQLRTQLEELQQSHDALLNSVQLAASNGNFLPPPVAENTTIPRALANYRQNSEEANVVFADTSTLTDDSDGEDESYFVTEQLPSKSYDHEHLRQHLKEYKWCEHGRAILSTVVTDRGRLKDPYLFPSSPGKADDRSHYSHYQVYDVGPDGTAELVETSGKDNQMSKATVIWHSIKVGTPEFHENILSR